MRSNPLIYLLARPERFELPTPWFVAKYSIQMSYGRLRGADYTEENAENKTKEHDGGGGVPPAGYFFWTARTRCARALACSADTSSGVLSLSSSQSSAPLMRIRATSRYRIGVTICRRELSPNTK